MARFRRGGRRRMSRRGRVRFGGGRSRGRGRMRLRGIRIGTRM